APRVTPSRERSERWEGSRAKRAGWGASDRSTEFEVPPHPSPPLAKAHGGRGAARPCVTHTPPNPPRARRIEACQIGLLSSPCTHWEIVHGILHARRARHPRRFRRFGSGGGADLSLEAGAHDRAVRRRRTGRRLRPRAGAASERTAQAELRDRKPSG